MAWHGQEISIGNWIPDEEFDKFERLWATEPRQAVSFQLMVPRTENVSSQDMQLG